MDGVAGFGGWPKHGKRDRFILIEFIFGYLGSGSRFVIYSVYYNKLPEIKNPKGGLLISATRKSLIVASIIVVAVNALAPAFILEVRIWQN